MRIYLCIFLCFSIFQSAEGKIQNQSNNNVVQDEWIAQLGANTFEAGVADEISRVERLLKRQKNNVCNIDGIGIFNKLCNKAKALNCDYKSLYFELRDLKRKIMFSDQEIDFSSILCVDVPYPTTGVDVLHEVRSRSESVTNFGGRMIIVNGFNPDSPIKQLAPQDGVRANFWRPDISYDGRKVVYCMIDSLKNNYHIYEMDIDGGNNRQVTFGKYNDFDPIYAPDGDMIFTTTRINQYLRCGGSGYRMMILARSDMNGKNMYFISGNVDADYSPVFLPDGRLLYTRWEYIDKSVFRVQGLWTVNPDGTGVNRYWGNQSYWPDMLSNARPIPGSSRIIFNANGHHNVFCGPLGVVDFQEGDNYPNGLYNLTPNVNWGEVGAGPEDKSYNNESATPECYKAFNTPYPVSENYILTSAVKKEPQQNVNNEHFNIYLMDYDGNVELIHQGNHNLLYPMPVRARNKPRVIPSSVKWPGKMTSADQKADPGIFYSANVYEGTGLDVGSAKYLRIMEIEPQTYADGIKTQDKEKALFGNAIPPNHGYGETVVSLVMDDATKKVVGTVPIEEDGSVNFKVPPVRALYFQLTDEEGKALHTMRSSVHAMPGEVRGCFGCHETKTQTPTLATRSIAMKRKPNEITPPVWGDSTVNFKDFVQPVLDKHCISCHNSDNNQGGFDFTYRTESNTLISWPYVKLVFGDNPRNTEEWAKKSIAGSVIPYKVYENENVKYPTEETVLPPKTAMSYNSKLVEITSSGKHHNVKVTKQEKDKIIAWVDALCPNLGLDDIIQQPDIDPIEFEQEKVFNAGHSYVPYMKSAPFIFREFMQCDFNTQEDRIPKDSIGNKMPSYILINGKRHFRIPERQ